MLSLVLAVVTMAGPPRAAAPGFIRENVSTATEGLVNEQLAVDFGDQGVEVLTATQVQSALAAQNLSELAGCEEGSCVNDVGKVLRVDALLLGSIARLGEAVQLELRLVSTTDGAVLTTFSKRAASEAVLLDTLKEAARSMAPKLGQKLGRPLTPLPRATPSPTGTTSLTPAQPSVRYERVNTPARNVGKWALIGGAILSGVSLISAFAFTDSDTALTISVVGLLSGVVVMGVGLIIYLVGGTELKEVKSALLPGLGGDGVAVAAPWWW